MAGITQRRFGVTGSGQEITEYTLENARGTTLRAINYGGTVTSLVVADRSGNPVDIVLGYDTLEAYEAQEKYLGALIGRHANRIQAARFSLNGREYPLAANDGKNHLHGGNVGFDKRIWDASVEDGALVLRYVSPDGEEGYPGTLRVQVRYTLDDADRFTLEYDADTDADTVCNLTNHSYFNLAGHASGKVLEQEIRLFAEKYTPADAESLPDGSVASVAGTPLDLREPIQIGAHIDEEFEQLRFAGGYDHNFVIDGYDGTLRPAAEAYDPGTGIVLRMETTLPGVQFYSGNYLGGIAPGKGGAPYGPRWGFCLESQYFPNALEHPNFLQPVLRAGEHYHAVTRYGISLR